MVVVEGHLAIIIGTTRAGPTPTFVIDRLRPALLGFPGVFNLCPSPLDRYLSVQ